MGVVELCICNEKSSGFCGLDRIDFTIEKYFMYVNVVAYQMKDQVVVAVPPIGWDNELLTVFCIQKAGCPPLVTEDYLWIHTRESMSWKHLQFYFYQLGKHFSL